MSHPIDTAAVAVTDSTEEIAANILRQFMPASMDAAAIAIDNAFDYIRVVYNFSVQPASSDSAHIQVTIHRQRNEAWIGDLFVNPDHRFSGMGTRLVQAAESLAQEMGVKTVNVWPLHQSGGFWHKMGYRPHRSTCRALSKTVTAYK